MHCAGLASIRRRPVNSALGRAMLHSRVSALQNLGEVGALRGRTAVPRLSEYPASEVRATSSKQVHTGASRRRAAPGSQPGLLRCAPSALRANLHRREDKPQHQAAATLLARPFHAGLVSGTPPACPSQPRRRGLTCRSTGAPTACRLSREALVVHHPPRGPGATPLSPG